MPREPFYEPQSIEDAERKRLELTSIVMDIQSQLSTKDKQNPDGTRMDEAAFHCWRRRTIDALKFRNEELRHIKHWIKNYHLTYPTSKAAGRGIEGETIESLTKAVFTAVANLCDYTRALEVVIRQLKKENETLRKQDVEAA